MQRCKAALSKAEADRDAAVDKADSAEKARRTAENNADALLTQTKVPISHNLASSEPRTLTPGILHRYTVGDRNTTSIVSSDDMQGLENEYDRLLASHDELQRRLSRLDPAVSDRTFGSQSKTD